MALNNNFEATVFVSSYPTGKSPWNLIDDKIRAILAGVRERMQDEHYWRYYNETLSEDETVPYSEETGSEGFAEGRHRPASARVWCVDVGSNSDSPAFPDVLAHHEGALFVVDGNPDQESDDTTSQWKGTVWFLKEKVLRPLITRLRGKVRFDGKMIFGPEIRKWQSKRLLCGATIDEQANERVLTGPATNTDNITVIPYHIFSGIQHGWPITTSPLLSTLYPIRVGQFAQSSDAFTASDSTDKNVSSRTPTYGLAIDVGQYDPVGLGRGTRFIFTERGLEVFTTNQPEGFGEIKFNGLNVLKHTHSGLPGMGSKLSPSAIATSTEDLGDESIPLIWSDRHKFAAIAQAPISAVPTELALTAIPSEKAQPVIDDVGSDFATNLIRIITIALQIRTSMVDLGEDGEAEIRRIAFSLRKAEGYGEIAETVVTAPSAGDLKTVTFTVQIPSVTDARALGITEWPINDTFKIYWNMDLSGGSSNVYIQGGYMLATAWRTR